MKKIWAVAIAGVVIVLILLIEICVLILMQNNQLGPEAAFAKCYFNSACSEQMRDRVIMLTGKDWVLAGTKSNSDTVQCLDLAVRRYNGKDVTIECLALNVPPQIRVFRVSDLVSW